MIDFRLETRPEGLVLKATGHAEKGKELLCCSFSTLVQNFIESVNHICGWSPSYVHDEKGNLELVWKGLHLDRGRSQDPFRFTVLVLIRALQIGIEKLKRTYPGEICIYYRLDPIWTEPT